MNKPTREAVAGMQGWELDLFVQAFVFNDPDPEFYLVFGGESLPHYSTEEGPSFFAMVRKVRVAGWEVVNMCYYRSTNHWYVRLDDAKFRPVTAIGDTLPLAFARAALLTTYAPEEK
jgi:hypothetical protein